MIVNGPKGSEEVDIVTANLFHKHLAVVSKHVGLRVSYRGPLALARGLPGFVPIEPSETFLEWTVGRSIAHTDLSWHQFTLSVSTAKAQGTVAQCLINGKMLYLQAKDLPDGRTLDDPSNGLPGAEKVTPRSLLLELADAGRG